MKFFQLVQRLHLWLGLLLGAQALLWMASGVVMSWFSIGLVRGETNALAVVPQELVAHSYANPGGPIAQTDGATGLRLKTFLGRPVYEVETPDGASLFDAQSGQRISPVPRETARDVAKRDFVGDGEIKVVEYLTSAPGEYRKKLPVWRVTFTDDLKTRIYVSPETGEIAARRNKIWRLYDFFWMLHIMDYKEREDFNNPLVKAASATGLFFALTGIYLVIALLLKGRFRLGGSRTGARESAAQQKPRDGAASNDGSDQNAR